MEHTPNPVTPYENAPSPAKQVPDDKSVARKVQPGSLMGLSPRLLQMRPQQIRRYALKLSALIFIVGPTVLTIFYYIFIAADQYAVEVRFSVRGNSEASRVDLLGAMTGMASAGSTVTDSYIVMNYIHSREILDKLQKRLDIRKIYSTSKADYFARFNESETVEEFLDYWKRKISVNFDTSSQIISVEAVAFTADDAKALAVNIITLSEQLINELSVRARNDAVKFARLEVVRAEKVLQQNRIAMRKFRDLQKELDPVKKAEAKQLLVGTLEGELASAQTQLKTISPDMAADAPTIIFLQRKIQSLKAQVKSERAKISTDETKTKAGEKTLSALLAEFEELSIAREFGQKLYASTLISLETARADANRQQRYLSTFVTPKRPQKAIYPTGALNSVLVFWIASMIWMLGVLTVYAIRDHRG